MLHPVVSEVLETHGPELCWKRPLEYAWVSFSVKRHILLCQNGGVAMIEILIPLIPAVFILCNPVNSALCGTEDRPSLC